jgi:hypothetical protein
VQDVDAAEHEIACLLGRKWWGKGHATEATAAIRDHARSRLGFDRLISSDRSRERPIEGGCAQEHHERDLTFEGRPTSLFSLQNRGLSPILQGSA